MILLKVKCDNIYMFKDFEIDFTYERKIKHPLSRTTPCSKVLKSM